MTRPGRGFAFADLPPVRPAVPDPHRDRRPAGHPGGPARAGRPARYRMSWTADDDWYLAPAAAARPGGPPPGGPTPPETDLAPLVRRGLAGMWLDVSTDWLLEVRRLRRTFGAGPAPRPARRPRPAVTAPPDGGPEYELTAVLRRRGLLPGPLRLRRIGEPEPCWTGVLAEGRMLVVDRRLVVCEQDDPLPGPAGPGSEEVLVVALTRWPAPARAAQPAGAPVGSIIAKPA
ncbi:hypothetical protein Sru01_11480 [Sphaerisporangium rufum]|uniref:Uncharacterized protein n=1 Tax=Sphaerisporangium rufum TaxID=1381558 RepID=A0A919UWM5_9ACTN|nr:hypothetical protein [Sphaerisporangium rufum]GII76166.1 hypothetical protein Sru01_11480 [Sphaerisporangium rufum]